MAKKKERNRGAPKKSDDKKIASNGLRPDQNKWLKEEGEIRNLPAVVIHREAVDWYITAKETKRGDVTASQQFDNAFIGIDFGKEGGDVTVTKHVDKFAKSS